MTAGWSNRWLSRAAVVLAATLIAPSDAFSQASGTPDDQAIESFEVASIRKNTSLSPGTSVRGFPGGRFVATNATVRDLIEFAFALQPYDTLVDDGVPRVLRETRFDITATAVRDVPLLTRSIGPMNRMVHKLLSDRFGMVTRFEPREQQVYILSLARSDGRIGPNLRPSSIDCAARNADPNRPSPKNVEEAMFCAIESRAGHLRARGHTTSQFAEFLSRRLRARVINDTGLVGPFEFELHYSSEGLPGIGIPPPPQFASQASSTEQQSGPSLFTALPEQLGLRLQAERRAVPALVIDRIEAPKEN